MSAREGIVVTGIGCVSPYGVGRELLWDSAVAGRCALRPLARFDASPYRNNLAGEVPDAPAVEALIAQGHDRAAAYTLLAADEAITQAGLDDDGGQLPGLVLGTNFGPMRAGEAAFRQRLESPENPAVDLSGFWPGAVLDALRGQVARRLGRVANRPGAGVEMAAGEWGPEAVVSLSCASGAAALATALAWLRAGRARAVIAGGFDELSETAFAGLSALRAISRGMIRPFDGRRDGSLFAEGAGVLVLETARAAARRGARPLAELAGAGLDNDAYHMTAPDRAATGIIRVMRMALADAGLSPEAIDHVNLHGTGTPYNDEIETRALREVFGAHVASMCFTANKSLFGHATGAAGALESALTVLSLSRGVVPPTIHSEEPDPSLDLPLVRDHALSRPLRRALSNSYGLGGTNACVLFAASGA